MSAETAISTYGYVAIAIGGFFEGETILVLAGFAAHRGHLHLPWVIVWGFLGTLCGDQLYSISVGRRA
jgi:membrane protein DedA with SNARE-associated domain